MRNPYDQLAKKIGKRALGACGVTLVQREISRDAQHADLLHDPDPAREAERARLGLLGRISSTLCLLEIHAHPPSAAEIRACLAKHFAYWEEREREGRAQRGKRRKPPVAPFLWIIAAVVSAPLLHKLRVEPAPRWPRGIYLFGGDVLRVGFVVANQLPRDRSTLLVRIMAAGPHLAEAVGDLAALPGDALERTVAEQILIHLQNALAKQPGRTAQEEEFVVNVQAYLKRLQDEGHDKGRKQGRREGVADALLTVLEARGIAVSDAQREHIRSQKNRRRLERWLKKAVVAATLADVLDEAS